MVACWRATAGFSERSSAFVPRPMRNAGDFTSLSASFRPRTRWMMNVMPSPRQLPVIKDGRNVDDGEQQQGDGEGDVDVEPGVADVLVPLLVHQAAQELFALTGDDEHLAA